MANIIMADVHGGSGGIQMIASGTWTGDGSPVNRDFYIGKKMPKKDFVFRVYAEDGSEFLYGTDYKMCLFEADSFGAQYDLSTESDNCPRTHLINYRGNKDGTITDIKSLAVWWVASVRVNVVSYVVQSNNGYQRIKRDATGFYVRVINFATDRYWVSGITYNWELLYIGSDAANDIVEVA